MKREPNTQYVLSLSYGKDSLACLEAIKLLDLPLDRIVHAEVWATDTISADLPPMVEFKEKADKIIKKRYGIEVEHICAMRDGEKLTYEKMFYHIPVRRVSPRERERESWQGLPKGFPMQRGSYCKKLKMYAVARLFKGGNEEVDIAKQREYSKLDHSTSFGENHSRISNTERKLVYEQSQKSVFSEKPDCTTGEKINIVQYLGIAADEPERIARHTESGKMLPLVLIGWDEAFCRKWCEENDLLSPIYTNAARGGCWFCHNQSVDQLRLLRKNHPDLWELLLKWDLDSPATFHSDGRTVHDFDKRFELEDKGVITPNDKKFRWKQVIGGAE